MPVQPKSLVLIEPIARTPRAVYRGSPVRTEQLDLVADAQEAAAEHAGVEREQAVEAAHDVLQDLDVLLLGVGIVGRHDAAAAEVGETDQHLARTEPPPLPAPLGE